MDKKQKFISVLVLYFAVISFLFTATMKLIERFLPSDGLIFVVVQTLFNAVVLIVGLYLITKHYEEEYFNRLKEDFKKTVVQSGNLIDDLMRAKGADKFLITDKNLFEKYESKVESNRAVIVVTPTFRNDYCGRHNKKTSGEKFAQGVLDNLSKGIYYRYISTREAVSKHVEHLATYHREALIKNPDAIKIFSTPVPVVSEMVHYPLQDASAFTILYTDAVSDLKVMEFNVKMLPDEDYERFIRFVQYVLNHPETELWEIASAGKILKPRDVNDNDRSDFTGVTGVSLLS